MHKAGERPLTLPVAPRAHTDRGSACPRGTRIASADPSSKRTTSPTQSAFPRQMLRCSQDEPLAQPFGEGARHRSRGFATDDPASDALSPLRRSRAEELDPSFSSEDWSEDSSSSGLGWATRRLSTSAIDVIREHDHGPPEPRMTSPAVARRCSLSRGHDLAIAALSCGWLPSSRPRQWRRRDERGQPRCHGPGASPRSACLGSAPLTAIARCESFAPTRSARTPHVAARDDASWRSLLRGALFRGTLARACRTEPLVAVLILPRTTDPLSRTHSPPAPLSRNQGKGRLARSPAKGSALGCTRGAFHRRITPAGVRSPSSCPQAVPSLWSNEPAPLRSPHRPGL